MLVGTNPLQSTIKPSNQRLLKLFNQLDSANQTTILAFIEFLAARQESQPIVIPKPELLPRPENESVVKALKRLKASYPMLESDALLHTSSALMTEHIMQGRPASEVIDELERLFASAYQQLIANTL